LDREDVEAALGFQLRLRKEGDMEDWLKRWGDGKILPWREMEREFRKEYFRYVRKIASSDAEAARMLGLAPPNFHRMCRELGLK
jgi:hypothetical protein